MAELLSEANTCLCEAQERYKRNFYAKLRKQEETIAFGESVYLCV